MDGDVVREVLAGLRLDVIDVLDTTWLDRDDLLLAEIWTTLEVAQLQRLEQIFRFLSRLPKETDGTYGSELLDVLASDERAAALYRARGRRGGRELALDQVLLFRIADGLVQEVLALPSDPDAFEAFWAP